ncbi:hypothetical protein E4O06_13835 [Treponema sp. OMZ 789]|nr:hypothetical protein E4O06_13835 [Treponema sp. OMZ 789]
MQDMDKGAGKVHFISVWGNGGVDDFMIFDNISFGMEFIKFDWNGEKYFFDDTRFNPEYIDILQRWEKISADYKLYADQLINYWVTRDKYFETGKFIQGSAYTHGLNDEERKPIISLSKTKTTTRSNELVGKVCGYNYKTNGEDEIALYIDRKQNNVFQKFNRT